MNQSSALPTEFPWSKRIAASALARCDMGQSRWNYEYGLLVKGIYNLWQQTGNSRYWQGLAAYVDRFVSDSRESKIYQHNPTYAAGIGASKRQEVGQFPTSQNGANYEYKLILP